MTQVGTLSIGKYDERQSMIYTSNISFLKADVEPKPRPPYNPRDPWTNVLLEPHPSYDPFHAIFEFSCIRAYVLPEPRPPCDLYTFPVSKRRCCQSPHPPCNLLTTSSLKRRMYINMYTQNALY